MTTDTRARNPPPGPEPKTIGKGPMKTTPPVDTDPCPDEPITSRPKPTRKVKNPMRRSFCKVYLP
jgi:hypothetical protein